MCGTTLGEDMLIFEFTNNANSMYVNFKIKNLKVLSILKVIFAITYTQTF